MCITPLRMHPSMLSLFKAHSFICDAAPSNAGIHWCQHTLCFKPIGACSPWCAHQLNFTPTRADIHWGSAHLGWLPSRKEPLSDASIRKCTRLPEHQTGIQSHACKRLFRRALMGMCTTAHAFRLSAATNGGRKFSWIHICSLKKTSGRTNWCLLSFLAGFMHPSAEGPPQREKPLQFPVLLRWNSSSLKFI